MSRSPAAGLRGRACGVLAVLTAAVVLTACSGGGTPAPAATRTHTPGASPSATANAAAATPPAMVAVTSAGALVTLDPVTGTVRRTLVPSGVLGDEVSVAASGMVYFAVKDGCSATIEEIPVGGGTPAVITAGSLPAVSPDGTRLAYADQPFLTPSCQFNAGDMLSLYHLKIRTLSSGATVSLPMVPASQFSGLPIPISHLSFAPDNQHLAVSIASAQDNEGWGVYIVDTASAQYYVTGPGTTLVPVTGQPTAQSSYLREGVYMPDGNLFVSRACCAGFPPHNTSRLMWEVNTSGVLVHQVAIGYPNLDHTSLDVSADGNWLLYLAGTTLYVSQGGATPKVLTTGLIAAAWA